MATTQQYSLKWNNYISHLAYHFESLRSEEEFTDVTLCCEGKKIKAHKIILSACSTYFRDVFKENPHPHPVIIFKNVKYSDLQSIIQFMYNGEVSVIQDLLPSFLQTAELLQVRGLTDTNLTESAKNLVAEEPRPTETLFFAVPQETNKLLTALSTTPLKTATVQPQEIHTIRLDASKLIEATTERGTPTLVKRKKITVQQAPPQPTVSTVQTYETLGLDQEGELMEAEEGVEFLQTGMKMEMPDFIDVPTSDRKTTTVSTEPTNYIQQDITYQIIDGRVVGKNLTTSQQAQQQDSTQETAEHMEAAENESGDLSGIFTTTGEEGMKSGQQAVLDASSQKSVEKKHPCSSCGKKFASFKSLLMHFNIHRGLTKCNICNAVLSRTGNLKRHIRLKHSNIESKVMKAEKE